jgi:hypothetical protein
VINEYLYSHGYRSEGLLEKEYFKEIVTPKRRERIVIDACSVEDINRLKGADIIIPWNLAFEHQIKKKVEGFELYIPKVEVMLLYKTKAVIDREFDLKSTFDPFYLQQKIVKDCIDIITLVSNCEINFKLLNDLLNKHMFTNYLKSVCDNIEVKREIDNKYLDKWRDKKNEFFKELNE